MTEMPILLPGSTPTVSWSSPIGTSTTTTRAEALTADSVPRTARSCPGSMVPAAAAVAASAAMHIQASDRRLPGENPAAERPEGRRLRLAIPSPQEVKKQ